jgi:hypothetical protein
MQLDAEAVERLLAMLEPEPASPEEAGRLAALTGSWPEMLAHLLLLRRGSLEPEIDAALRAHAEQFRGGPIDRRPPQGPGSLDLGRQARSERALEEALAAVLATERERAEAMAAADAALRDHTLAHPRRGFDLHRRIGREPG